MTRVLLLEEKQNDFISRVCKKQSLQEFLKEHSLEVPYSTFKKYYYGKFLLPFDLFKNLCKIGNLNVDEIKFRLLDENWGAIKGGQKGIKVVYAKYGQYLKKWRSKGGKNSMNKRENLKKISLPPKKDGRLAEFIGVYLGDGTLTKYFVRISGDKRYDKQYFEYLAKNIEKMFNIKPKIREEIKRNILYLEIQSKLFCDFLKSFGFKEGDKIKNKAKIPRYILNNKELSINCLRGLIDTDGSISSDNNLISIRFASGSKELLDQVERIGKSLGIFTFKTQFQTGTRSMKNIKRYFKEIGSSNMRHIIRFCESLKGNIIKKDKVLGYYQKYMDIKPPFIMDA